MMSFSFTLFHPFWHPENERFHRFHAGLKKRWLSFTPFLYLKERCFPFFKLQLNLRTRGIHHHGSLADVDGWFSGELLNQEGMHVGSIRSLADALIVSGSL